MKGLTIFLVTALLLAGCVSMDAARQEAVRIGHGGGMVAHRMSAGHFQLSVWEKLLDPGKALHVYIEGDRAARRLHQTSHNPVALRLAARDHWPNVFYLAQPCQLMSPGDDPACDERRPRYVSEVVAAMDAAISHVVQKGQKIRLFGYAGGGSVAALIARQRSDIEALVTIAGNLALLPEADDVAQQLANLPQIHFVEENNATLSNQSASAWIKQSGHRCVQMVVVPNVGHDAGWDLAWGWMQTMVPSCSR